MSHKTKVINFFGGPGIGKTITSCLLFAKLKMNGHVAEFVPEYAKTLVWKKDYETLKNQYYVSRKQYSKISILKDHVDFIITDSPIALGIYYNRFYPDNVSDKQKTEEMIISSYHEFDNVNFFLRRNKDEIYEQRGRLQTEEEAKKIDEELKSILLEFSIPFVEVDACDVSKVYSLLFS